MVHLTELKCLAKLMCSRWVIEFEFLGGWRGGVWHRLDVFATASSASISLYGIVVCITEWVGATFCCRGAASSLMYLTASSRVRRRHRWRMWLNGVMFAAWHRLFSDGIVGLLVATASVIPRTSGIVVGRHRRRLWRGGIVGVCGVTASSSRRHHVWHAEGWDGKGC